MKRTNPSIVCKDGFRMSVQASEIHYCSPRVNYPGVPYDRVEVGYPSAHPGDEMIEYQESPDRNDPTDDVYPYVPVEVVERVIEAHGGIESGSMPAYEYH